MIEDATYPGGYRIAGMVRLPIALDGASPNERAADQREADQRLRKVVAGGIPSDCGGARAIWIEEAFAA